MVRGLTHPAAVRASARSPAQPGARRPVGRGCGANLPIMGKVLKPKAILKLLGSSALGLAMTVGPAPRHQAR